MAGRQVPLGPHPPRCDGAKAGSPASPVLRVDQAAPDPGLRADLLATLIAARWTDEKILRLTDITPSELESFRASPLLKALLARDQPKTPVEKVEDLFDEALETWKLAMTRRDDDMPSALRAADAVADRVLPKKQIGQAEPVIHIHLDAKERAQIERVAKEVGHVIEVHPLLSLDEAIEKYRQKPPNGDDSE
jgi:hypothetical protein